MAACGIPISESAGRSGLARLGPQSLSNAELIAILLRVGVPGENAVQVGQRLLHTYGGISGLQRADFKDVCSQHGMGTAKVAQIKAAIELGRRLTLESPEGSVGDLLVLSGIGISRAGLIPFLKWGYTAVSFDVGVQIGNDRFPYGMLLFSCWLAEPEAPYNTYDLTISF